MGLIARIKDRLFDRRNVIEIESLEEGGEPLSLESLKNTTLYKHRLTLSGYPVCSAGCELDIATGTMTPLETLPSFTQHDKTIVIISTNKESYEGTSLSQVFLVHSDYDFIKAYISLSTGSIYNIIGSNSFTGVPSYLKIKVTPRSLSRLYEMDLKTSGGEVITISKDVVTKL